MLFFFKSTIFVMKFYTYNHILMVSGINLLDFVFLSFCIYRFRTIPFVQNTLKHSRVWIIIKFLKKPNENYSIDIIKPTVLLNKCLPYLEHNRFFISHWSKVLCPSNHLSFVIVSLSCLSKILNVTSLWTYY